MNSFQAKKILVDALAGYLATGKHVSVIEADVATPNVGSGSTDSDELQRVRALLGVRASEIEPFLKSLVGFQGTTGKLSYTPATGLFAFVADE